MGHNYIGVEHLLLGIIKEGEGTAVRILEGLNCDLQKLRKLVEGSVRPSAAKPGGSGNIPLVKQAEKILKITYLEAKIFKSGIIGTEHLLLSILKDEDNVATKSIHAFNIDYDVAKEEFENLLSENGGARAPRALTTPCPTTTPPPRVAVILVAPEVPAALRRAKETPNPRRLSWTTLDVTSPAWRRKAVWTPLWDAPRKLSVSVKS